MKVISQYNSMATVHQLRDLKYIPSENANMREDTHTHTHTHTHTLNEQQVVESTLHWN